MTAFDTFEQRISYLCAEAFLEARYPSELPFLPTVWSIIRDHWEVTKPPGRGAARVPLRGLGLPFSDDVLQLVSPIVILVMASVTRELKASLILPESDAMRDAILEASKILGASDAVATEIAASIGPRLYRMWRELDFISPESPGAVASKDLGGAQDTSWYVDWCERWASPGEKADVKTDRVNSVQARKRFRDNKEAFVLFVDEAEEVIVVNPNRGRGKSPRNSGTDVEWDELDARHQAMLLLVLEAFLDRLPIGHDRILERAMNPNSHARSLPESAVRTAKSELNKRLKGILSDVLVAKKGMRRYEIRGQIPYCWIRPCDRRSRLSRGSPQ